MTSLFLPSNLPVQMFVFVSTYLAFHHIHYTPTDNDLQAISTLVIGVLLGWGIGAAGMRGALAARDQILLKKTLEKVESRYISALSHYNLDVLIDFGFKCCRPSKPGTSV
jgi:hypothetical protein